MDVLGFLINLANRVLQILTVSSMLAAAYFVGTVIVRAFEIPQYIWEVRLACLIPIVYITVFTVRTFTRNQK